MCWLLWLSVAVVLVGVAIHDARCWRIPNVVSLPLGVLILALCLWEGPCSPSLSSLWGGLAWWATPFVCRIFPVLRRPALVAAGDRKLALSLGTLAAAFEPWGVLVAVGLSGVLTAVMFMFFGDRWRASGERGIPHAPSMVAATAVAIGIVAVSTM